MFSEIDKIEEELRFLKESFDAGVISNEEYDIAKERLNSKLRELSDIGAKEPVAEEIKERQESSSKEKTENETKETEKEILEEIKKQETKEEQKEEQKELEEKTEAEKEKSTEYQASKLPIEEEKTEEKPEEIEQIEIKEEAKEVQQEEEAKQTDIHEKETKEEQKELEETTEAETQEKAEEEKPQEVWEEKTGSKKIFVYLAVIILFGIVSWYFFFSGNSAPLEDVDAPTDTNINLIACSSDSGCIEEGKIGICLQPGQEDAECRFIDDAKLKLIVLNDENCFNCETKRVLSIIKNFFPNLETKTIDFNTAEGRGLAKKLQINALPAYILNSSFEDSYNYDKFSSSFNEVDGSFVMKNTVSSANFYIGREEIPNKLNLFFKPGESVNVIAEENLNEFLEAFDGKVDFEKHTDSSRIVRELQINTFPAFLINNKIKFSGVQPADKIREYFCEMNNLKECGEDLTKSLI